jgi:hypothetical protein
MSAMVVVVRGYVVAAQDSTVQDSAGWLRVNYFGLELGVFGHLRALPLPKSKAETTV